MSREGTVSGAARVHTARMHARRPSIFGRRCRAANAKVPVLKVRRDAALRASAAGSRPCCGLDIIPARGAGSSRRPTVLVFPVFIKPKKKKKKRKAESGADAKGRRRKEQFCRIELLWHRYSVCQRDGFCCCCCYLNFAADVKWESASSPV